MDISTSSVHPIHAYERTFIGLCCLAYCPFCLQCFIFYIFKEMDRYTRFLHVAVVATLFATGINTPFKVVKFLWDYIPLFISSEIQMKFTLLVCYIAYSYLIDFMANFKGKDCYTYRQSQ